MENEHNDQLIGHQENGPRKTADGSNAILIGSGMIAVALIVSTLVYVYGTNHAYQPASAGNGAVAPQNQSTNAPQESITPSSGVVLSAIWGDLGKQMVDAGVINETQFKALYARRGGLSADMQAFLDSGSNGKIMITSQNAGVLLNLLWALGLSNKNPILESGRMQNPQYGGAANFASTGGWTLAEGNAMNHYAAHQFVTLTPDEQTLVETVAKNIYRPCCGNSTYFPDCNHGMAMLGLLELMASQGATADQMYEAALAVNSYWFPDTYLTLAKYFAGKGIAWDAVDPKTVLGADYSSAQGYQNIVTQTSPVQNQSSGSNCGA